jgi:hypothetical protein
MHEVPEYLNLDRLIGQQLQQICIGAYDLQFRFMGDDRIRCTGLVHVVLDGEERLVFGEDLWHDSRPLTSIVGRDVTDWRRDGSHVLVVELGSNAAIRFTSQDSPYEDFIVDPEVQVW